MKRIVACIVPALALALLSDAGHNFGDALALILSWYGLWIAQRPSSAKRTFGYHRVGILVALVNAVSLVVIALLIFWEAASRLGHPEPVKSTPMIVVALIAILLNTVISLWLRSAAKKDLNVRSTYMHMLGDAVSAAGVVVAGVVVAFRTRRHSDERMIDQILKGGDGMPAFKEKLKQEEINDLVHFIRGELQSDARRSQD